MKFNGHQCRVVRSLGWRSGNPEMDKDESGNPVKPNFLVIVRIADCKITTEKNGRQHYNPDGVKQAFPLLYSGTHYGWRTLNATAKKPIRGYVVLDGKVYSFSQKKLFKKNYLTNI